MSAETIKDFLVSLSFSKDEAGFHRTMESVESLTKKMVVLGGAIEAAAIASIAAMHRIAMGMEAASYASSRIGASVSHINEFKFAIANLGGTAAGAMSSLENFSRFLRESPGGEAWLRGIGIVTRDARGELRDRKELMDEFFASRRFTTEPYWAQLRDSRFLGIDEDTMRAGMNPERHAREAEVRAKYRNASFDPDKAAEAGKKFEQVWRSLGLSIDIIGDKVAMAMAGPAGDKFRQLIEYLDHNSGRIADGLIIIGNAIVDCAGQLISWIGHVAEWEEKAEKWIAANPQIADGLKKITDALGPLGTALAALVTGAALRGLVGLLGLAGLGGIASFIAGGAIVGTALGLSGDSAGADEKAWQSEHPESSAKESWIGRTARDASNWVREKLGMGQYRGSGPAPSGGAADEVEGKPGQFRKPYSLSEADLSDTVINHIAGEAQNNKKSIDAVINTMMNRLGTKAYGPSGNLHEVVTSPGQWVGIKNASAEQAKFIRERIKAIASGAVSDITSGANEMRGSYYTGPWAQRHSGAPVIGGNRFAKNPDVTGPYASHTSADGASSFGLNGWLAAGGGYAHAPRPPSSFGLNGWIAAGGGVAYAAPALAAPAPNTPVAAAPIGHSSVSNYDFGSNVIHHKPTFNITAAGDPGATADAVAKKQGSLYADALRNLQGSAR